MSQNGYQFRGTTYPTFDELSAALDDAGNPATNINLLTCPSQEDYDRLKHRISEPGANPTVFIPLGERGRCNLSI